jgi:gliding motility-associated-like protein
MMKKGIVLIFILALVFQKTGAQLLSPNVTAVNFDTTDQKYHIKWDDNNKVIFPDTFKIYVFSGNYTGLGQPIYDPFLMVDGTQVEATIDPQFTVGTKTYDLFNNVYFFAVEAFKTGKTPSSDNLNRRPYVDAPNNILLNLKQSDFDTCNYSITIKWSKFYGWASSDIRKYKIWYRIGTGPFKFSWKNGTDNYFHDTTAVITVNYSGQPGQHLLFNTNYSFQIEEVNETRSISAFFSNIRSINTDIATKPEYINADGTLISGDNKTIQLSFTKDNSPLHKYKVLRSDSYDGVYSILHSFENTMPTIIDFDTIDAVNKQYYYKIEAFNNCWVKVGESNIESNILLKGQQNQNVNNLYWTGYQKFAGNLGPYYVFRSMQPKPLVYFTTTTDTLASDRLDTIAEKGILELSYYVIANEANNPYGLEGRISRSNTITITIDQKITMPDFFTPKGLNPYIKPPVSFYAKDFKFTIYNRWGTKVFETTVSNSNGWDGKVNGSYAPQGTYIYYLKVVGTDNAVLEQKGTFLLIQK